MIPKFSSQKGLTLIELLASIVIFFIVSLLVFNIVYSSTKQNHEQSNEATQINNAAYLLKQITKDIRKTNNVETKLIDAQTTYIFKNSNPSQGSSPYIAEYMYDVNEKALYRNSSVLVNNVENFSLSVIDTDDEVEIEFLINGKNHDTKIALRKGKK